MKVNVSHKINNLLAKLKINDNISPEKYKECEKSSLILIYNI